MAGTSPGPETFSREIPGDCTTQTQGPALTTTFTDGDLGCRQSRLDSSGRVAFRFKEWSLNDVLNEVAFCRQVFHTSLAPRPKPMQNPRADQPKRKPELPKPIPKKPKPEPKASAADKPSTPAGKNPKWNDAWLKKLSDGKGICIRFHLGKCKSGQQCRYAHQCPVAKANGETCGGFHSASRHKESPH